MLYLIFQVLQILLIATLLGFVLGWILRRFKATRVEQQLNERIHQSEAGIQPIKTALSAAESDIEGRDHSIAKLQAKLADFDKKINPIQDELGKLTGRLGRRDASILGLQQSVNDKDGQLARLAANLDQEKAAVRQADQALADAHGKRHALEARLNEMRVRLDNNDAATQAARSESAALQKEINKLQIDLNSSLQKLEQESKDHGKANAALADAENNKIDAEKKIESLKTQLNEKATDHKLAKAESAALQREIDLLKDQLSRLQKAHDSHEADLKLIKKEKTEIARNGDNKANKLDTELTQRNASIAELEKQLKGSKDEQQVVTDKLAQAKEKLDASNRATNQAAKEQARLEQKIGLLEAKISAQEKELAEALAQKKAGDVREGKLTGQIAALKDDLNSKITDLKLATGQRDGLIKDVASLEKELSKLDGEARNLKLSLDKSKDQHNDKIATLKASIADKEARAADGGLAVAKVAQLEKASKAAEKEHLAALQKADKKISDMTRELDQLSVQSKMDADNNKNRIIELDKSLAAAIADKEAYAADGGLADAKIAQLEKASQAAEKEHLAALQQADKKISDMTRELDNLSVQSKMDADNNKNRISELDKSLAAAIAEKKDLAKDYDKLLAAAGESSDNEKSLLRRIEELENEVQLARKSASQSMMTRILELEAMLEAEKRKAEDHRSFNNLAELSLTAPSVTRTRVSANTEIRKKKKAG